MRLKYAVLLLFIFVSGCSVNIRGKSLLTAARLASDSTGSTQFRQISAGEFHICFHDSDGSLKCWGDNSKGQIKAQPNWTPSVVAGITPSSSTTEPVIGVGFDHTCVVTNTGELKCWGMDFWGQVGDPSYASAIYTPYTAIASGVTALATGRAHNCVIVTGGELQCFGHNDNGQIALGSRSGGPGPTTPQTVFASGVTKVSAEFDTTCAVVSGALKCWGYGWDGGVGDGVTASYVTSPYEVFAAGVTEVSVGFGHTCAIQGGALKCWGSNTHGQIGNGASGAAVLAPYTVIATGVTWVKAESNYTCAVASGALSCWGQTGISGIGTVSSPTAISLPGDVGDFKDCAISGGALLCTGLSTNVSRVGVGIIGSFGTLSGVTSAALGQHGCAAASGQLYCWGKNDSGEVGNSDQGNKIKSPYTVFASGVSKFSTGREHTCAVVSGALKCWGANDMGQIGDTSLGPIITTPLTVIPSGVTDVIASYDYTCAVVSGAVKCFGDNQVGQIGNGTSGATVTTPHTVIASGVEKIYSSGAYSVCASKTDHSVWCFGALAPNILNDGNLNPVGLTPLQLNLPSGELVDFSMGYTHACAIMSESGTRKLYCWGDNTYAQIVNDSVYSDGMAAQLMATSTTLEKVEAGMWRTCFIDGGNLKCRGQNDVGEIDYANPAVPVYTTLTLTSGASCANARGANQTCALVGNDVNCWGFNLSGGLGTSIADSGYGVATLLTSIGP